jgi:oxygen-independent coproporphyrinogen-3 oxidase
LHWGGGTPTHLDANQLRRLYQKLASRFELLADAEVSIELHPHVTSPEQVETLVALGFNRFSMGVQDTDAHVQAVVHRDQTVEDTLRIVEQARGLGVEGINLDLMYGLPAQTEATFARTLETIESIRPDRLAVYGYAHLPWRIPAQGVLERDDLPDAVLRARLFATAVEGLTAAGYEVIGLDHFALREDALFQSLTRGDLQRNFMGYTTQRAPDMIAFGMSAISDVGGSFLQNARSTADYETALATGGLATVRGLARSDEDDLRRAVIQSLMCRMRLDLDELEGELGCAGLEQHFAAEWERLRPLEAEGLCRLEARRVEVTPLGRLFLRHLAMVFDAYLELDSAPTTRFSQTV